MIFKTMFMVVLLALVSVIYVSKDHLLQVAGTERRNILGPHVADYTPVTCPQNAVGIYLFGQSNSANTVRPMKSYQISSRIVQYDWRTDACYLYQEPLLGAMDFHSNPITPFVAELQNELSDPIVIIPFGVPGSRA